MLIHLYRLLFITFICAVGWMIWTQIYHLKLICLEKLDLDLA